MRKHKAIKRPVTPDAIYNSELVTRLVNCVMFSGKKATAEAIVYTALDTLGKKITDRNPVESFIQAIENCRPVVQVKSRRVGGANYQVPVEIIPERQISLAMRWLVNYARNKKGKPMAICLGQELVDAFNNTGNAVKKKDETHKMAAANKAFAHYRF
jgi:small subunit ribosomal protein S7